MPPVPGRNILVLAVAQFISEQSDPDAGRYVFTYRVTIRNEGETPAQLINRHWIITDASGQVQEVRGRGVIGEQPRLEPGEAFEYTSGCVLETPVGTMHGTYQMRTDEGEQFDAVIPEFVLAAPSQLH
ncbi:Co2+/Mg2+ efflux protein ApaG [Niveibacterium sp. SC-1]|uniref:Co2+/Mg2+ efflux protein ApaG n=1 Tax=Niveibacterium sp. SC-1 TaxID=3135646 RepID=UPI00311EE1B4